MIRTQGLSGRPSEGGSRSRSRAAAIAGAALVVATATLPATAYPRPGRTELVSVASDGTQGSRGSGAPSISADGRYVAFGSFAENLVPGPYRDPPLSSLDVFLRDRQAGTTERVPVAVDGGVANNVSDSPSISADGRYVAFRSFASNLVPGDTNGFWDVFVRDRETGVIERVSVGAGGEQGNDRSFAPSVSADGRYVAFWSIASNLVPGDTNLSADVFVRDRQAETTERVSVGEAGAQGNGDSLSPSISATGRHVAFVSGGDNLVPGDTNDSGDVFVHDRETEATERVSVGAGGAEGNGPSFEPSISADGRVVAFNSEASNLIPSDTNHGSESFAFLPFHAETFVRDRAAGTTERVSVGSEGGEKTVFSWATPAISADGRYIAFNHYSDHSGGIGETFVRDRVTGSTELVSVKLDGAYTGGPNDPPSISADGRYVAFHSRATNLVPEDANGRIEDVFVRDRGRPIGVGDLTAVHEGDRVSAAGWATFSGAVVASAADPPGDGGLGAAEVGADLTGAHLTYRPEEEDLLVRHVLASMPTPPTYAVRYVLEFFHAGVRYEVRAEVGTEVPDFFGLWRCDPICTEQASLSGGIGRTGAEAHVSLPLSALGAGEGATLSQVRAFTTSSDSGVVFDGMDLPDANLPAASVRLGIAPEGTSEDGVSFATPAALTNGTFGGSLDVSGLPRGTYDVWASACLGSECGADSTEVHIEGNLPPVLDPIGDKSAREGETLEFTVTASDPDGDPLTLSGSGLPPGASFEPPTGTFSWTPAFDQAGSYEGVRFQVTDGQATDSTDSEEISITVANVNRAPTVELSAAPTTGNSFRRVTFTIAASDPDPDDAIRFWTLDADGDGAPEFSGSGSPPPTIDHVYECRGTYTARAVVGDGADATAADEVQVTVKGKRC